MNNFIFQTMLNLNIVLQMSGIDFIESSVLALASMF